MADSSKTEQPTQRRLQKAREQGQVARSRDLSSTLSLLAAIMTLSWVAPRWVSQWRGLFSSSLSFWSVTDLTADTGMFRSAGATVVQGMAPVVLAAWATAIATMLAQGKFAFTTAPLTPNFSRLNPANHLKQLFSSAGLSRIAKSLIPLAFIAYLGFSLIMRDWGLLTRLTDLSPARLPQWLFQRVYEIAWKSSGVLLVWSGLDFYLQKRNLQSSLRMSKQEVKDEHKDSEGNPQTKRRVRQLQRQLRRRRLLKSAAKATVVVTNPTHYAVALKYELDTMVAPVVLVKGCDRIALEIRRIALWNGVPIVENRPLAQLLYRTVEEGQVIPAKLYMAVAEILAFVFRMQAARQGPSASGGPNGRGNTR